VLNEVKDLEAGFFGAKRLRMTGKNHIHKGKT